MTDARNITYGRQKGSANQWWCPFGSSGEHMRQHLCRNTHNLLHGCSHRCPPGSSYRTMWHLPIEHEKPLNTETLSHSHVHFDSMWMWALMFVTVQMWSTYHRVADLEHFTEQNPTLSFCKGLSKRIQIAGVPYIRTVYTLMGHAHTNRHSHTTVFYLKLPPDLRHSVGQNQMFSHLQCEWKKWVFMFCIHYKLKVWNTWDFF